MTRWVVYGAAAVLAVFGTCGCASMRGGADGNPVQGSPVASDSSTSQLPLEQVGAPNNSTQQTFVERAPSKSDTSEEDEKKVSPGTGPTTEDALDAHLPPDASGVGGSGPPSVSHPDDETK